MRKSEEKRGKERKREEKRGKGRLEKKKGKIGRKLAHIAIIAATFGAFQSLAPWFIFPLQSS